MKILTDFRKTVETGMDPRLQQEAKLQHTLRKLRKNGHLSDDEHRKIYPKG